MLTQASRYAIRATIYLAERPGRLVLRRDIAADLEVPGQFLAKILQSLARDGLLVSLKGRGGGFGLALPPSRISLLRVVRAIEGEDYAKGCVLGLPRCEKGDPCALHDAWKEARGGFLTALRTTRLSDIEALPEGLD